MELLDTHAEISANALRLVEGIAEDQWALPTPCSEWNVRQLVNHMAFTTAALEASARRQAPSAEADSDLLGDAPCDAFRTALASNEAAWRAEGALDGMVSFPFEAPATAALSVNILDIGTHSWDLAQATGQPHQLSDQAIATIDAANRSLISDDVRAGGGFGDALTPSNDDALTSMLAFVGRAS